MVEDHHNAHSVTDAEIAVALRTLARRRAPATFCPSEVARGLASNWRPLMPRVRDVATRLGLRATQKGQPVDAVTARGPIRLALGDDAEPDRDGGSG